jgi:hypothetical protein
MRPTFVDQDWQRIEREGEQNKKGSRVDLREEDKMGLVVRMMNVGRGERIFRFIIGVFLIALAFLISGFTGLILGLIGVAIIPTAIFGY